MICRDFCTSVRNKKFLLDFACVQEIIANLASLKFPKRVKSRHSVLFHRFHPIKIKLVKAA